MTNRLRLPALDGQVLIDNDTVSVTNNEGAVIHLTFEEWELLRKELRFDDTVDYKRGETPMSIYCLQEYIKLMNENQRLKMEIKQLKDAIQQS